MRRPITDRQRQTLLLVSEGKRIREILEALGLSPGSTQLVYDTFGALMMKGALVYRQGSRPGQWKRYEVTPLGWSELGRKICPACQGHGTIPR